MINIRKHKRTFYFHSKTDDVFQIEVIKNLKELPLMLKDKVINDIRQITIKAWGDPKDAVEKWVSFSEIIITVKLKNELHGFSLAGNIEENVIFFPATIILPESHNKGLAKVMWVTIIKFFLEKRIRKYNFRIWEYFSQIYIVFLTPNPTLYEIISKRIDLVPSINGRLASAMELSIAEKAARICSPGFKFNTSTFVNEKVDIEHPELIYKTENIPWASDPRINNFFENHLKLSKQEGNNFVIVGKLPFLLG